MFSLWILMNRKKNIKLVGLDKGSEKVKKLRLDLEGKAKENKGTHTFVASGDPYLKLTE